MLLLGTIISDVATVSDVISYPPPPIFAATGAKNSSVWGGGKKEGEECLP